jgi:putative ABC transport system permease protein
VSQFDANLPVSNIATMDSIVSRSVAPRRFNMSLLAVFAAIALVLAIVGIYGVLAYSVARRTAEIGLRAALGATPRNILTLIIAQGMQPIAIGIALGLAGALGLSRSLTGMLYGIQPADPLTYVSVAGLMLLVALFSCYVPARRALRVDPAIALREE